MKLFFDGSHILKQSPRLTNKNKNGSSIKAKSLYTITLLVLIGSVAIFWGLNEIHAQTTQGGSSFKVIVEVVNNGNLDEHGTIHVAMDGSRASHVLNDQIFPAFQTISRTFEFSSSDAPVGKGFTAEVIYGEDEIKRAFGTNTPANSPEIVTLNIP